MRLGFCAALLLTAVSVAAAQPLPRFSNTGYLARLAEDEAPLADFLAGARPAPDTMRRLASPIQRYVISLSQLGDTEGAIAAFDRLLPLNADGGDAPDAGGLVAEPALAAIVREAASRQIVIVNEAHHVPMHRAFSLNLMRRLRGIGYTHLAAEALSRQPGLLGNDLVLVTDGYYTADPVFAQFIGTALRDGWTVVPYDVPGAGATPLEQIASREQGEAENLVARIFSQNPRARVFIHAGYMHNVKAPSRGPGGTIEWMAARLKRLTGIDPLTIDQTVLFSHPDRTAEHAAYRPLVAAYPAREPVVLRKPGGGFAVFGRDAAGTDMQVVHPPTRLVRGRPAWLAALAGRAARDVPAELLPKAGRRAIYAFPAGVEPIGVATDIVLAEAGKPAPPLMLPAGEFVFMTEDEPPRAR